MIIAVSRPSIELAGAVDPTIENLVNLMPDYSAGQRLHQLYVNKMESALPGNYSQAFGSGPSFRSVFFGSWQADPLLAMVDDAGLNASWWSGFAVAVLCQAIAELGSDIRGQMLSDKINADVASFNAQLRTHSARVYSRVLAATYNPLVALLQQVNPATAKQQFHDALLGNVINRQLWYQAGMWTSPDWEMFNQYTKYMALGASDAEVDTLIGELVADGLPVPSTVTQQTWRGYAEELRDKPTIDVNDIRAVCSGPVTEPTYSYSEYGSTQMPNGNSYEFTANGQPGSPYRRPPGGSCFTGSTQVLDGTGRAVPLRGMKAGDTVLTRDGTATVAYLAQPLRADRPLHRLTGGGPVFTGTHPFINGAPADPSDAPPLVLAVEPSVLAAGVPTLSEDGIGALTAGSMLLSRGPGQATSPVPVVVTGVETVPPAADDTYLFDLRLVTQTGARQEFWVGDGEKFYLATPEYPVLDQAGPAATTVVATMEGLLASGGPAKSGWPISVIDVVNKIGPGIFRDALMQALATTPSFGAPAPTTVYDRIDRVYQDLGSATAETASVGASLFDGLLASVGQWLASLVTLGWRTCRLLGGEVVAVSVFDIALTPAAPVPADGALRLDVTVAGHTSTDGTYLWDRRGRANTRFHHYFDQIVHLDLAGDDRPLDLAFTITTDGAAIPILSADVPGAVSDAPQSLQSAPLRDASGTVVGTIRFDTRRLGQDAAAQELGVSGTWTDETAVAYANALGVAMVDPILSKLRPVG